MRPLERLSAVRTISSAFAGTVGWDAAVTLSTASIACVSGWDDLTDAERQAFVTKQLVNASPVAFDHLLLTVQATTIWFDHLRGCLRSEAQLVLKEAGAERPLATEWFPYDETWSHSTLLANMAQQTPKALAALIRVGDKGNAGDGGDALVGANASRTHERTVEVAGLKRQIFVVHGHAHAVLHETVRVLERATDREVIVLHEQANEGRTILEKFEHHANDAAFAVVLLTADDEGSTASSSAAPRPRGRQNVIFELGFFFGKLGRQHVTVLLEENVERPSDIDGLVYITLDPGGAWKHALARELASAGIPIDHARIP